MTIPYLDSLVTSLETRFDEDSAPAYALSLLHPANVIRMSLEEFKRKTENFVIFYEVDNFVGEVEVLY